MKYDAKEFKKNPEIMSKKQCGSPVTSANGRLSIFSNST